MLFANKSPSCSRRVQGRRHCPGVRCKKKRRIVKLNTNQILSSRSLESSAARKEVWEIFSFILHRGAHNSVLLLDSLHGRNSQTQLAPSRLLKSRGFFFFFFGGKKRSEHCGGGEGSWSVYSEYQRLTVPSVSVPARLIQRVYWQTLSVTLVPLCADW